MISKNQPFITVLLPVYNCEKYIFEAVESILNQTYSNFELLIIDDCSTDNTLQICKSFQDDRIIIIEKEKNSGYTNSLNYGISIAKGKYIARMDGDDISLPTRFEKQVAFLEKNQDVIVCGTNYSIIGSKTKKILPKTNDEIQIQFIKNNCIAHPSIMIRKSALNENNIVYDITKEPAEDYDLWMRLLNYGKLHNLQELLLNYRVHQNQVSYINSIKQHKISLDIKIDLFKNLTINFDDLEKNVLVNLLSNIILNNLEEIKLVEKVNQKILKNNQDKHIFNQQLLSVFFKNEEKRILKRYFLSNKHFKPYMIVEYYKSKTEKKPKLKIKEELKLILKCLIHYKVK